VAVGDSADGLLRMVGGVQRLDAEAKRLDAEAMCRARTPGSGLPT
jgi:hypothetical protein